MKTYVTYLMRKEIEIPDEFFYKSPKRFKNDVESAIIAVEQACGVDWDDVMAIYNEKGVTMYGVDEVYFD